MTATARFPQKAGPDFPLHRSLDTIGNKPASGKIQSLSIAQGDGTEEGFFIIAKGAPYQLPRASRTCEIWLIKGELTINGQVCGPAMPGVHEPSIVIRERDPREVLAKTNVFVFVRYPEEVVQAKAA